MANKYKIGQEVIISTKEIPDKKGTIRFMGKIQGKPDDYVGIQLDQPVGKNNGDFQGKIYFKTQKISDKGQFYGVFVKPVSIKPLPQTTKKTTTTSKPIKAPTATGTGTIKNKLGNELAEQQTNQVQKLKEQLQSAYEKISQFQNLDSNKQIQSLRSKVKQLNDINRSLKLQVEQVRYQTDNSQVQKVKQLADKLLFFQNQKELGQKQKSQLRKKIERLQTELQQSADRQQMLDKLTIDVEQLQSKNQKLKSQLESAKTQLKNSKILGSGSGKGNQQLQQSITTLNEMVSLMQSDLNEQKQKNALLEAQIQNNSTKLSQLVKLQRRLKSRDEQVQMMKIELETLSDAAGFVQNLTFANLKKDEELKQLNKKLKQYAQKVNKYENETSISQDMIDLQTQEMEHLQEQIQKHLNQKQDKNKHIILLNQQINKYKNKIRELTDNNSSLIMNMEDKDDQVALKTFFNTDIYQHKYYQLSKLNQQTQAYLLDYQLQMSSIRYFAGTYLANLVDTLPETFSSKLYPHIMMLLVKISGTNHKLYLLYEIVSNLLTNKSELYAADQQNLVSWYLLLLDQIPLLYNSLLKIQFAIISADGQQDIVNIVTHPDLKQQVNRIDVFSQELLYRITTQNIDIEGDFDPFIDPVQILDKIVLQVKRLPTELATRLDLCIETMRCITQLLSSIEIYRRNSEARQSSQVDTMLQNFLKILQGYLRQCCTNSHIRLKNDMKSYLSGIDLVIKILKEIQLNDSLQQLNSLYSDTEDIKMLKETILTTQFHLKQLNNDLQLITYNTPLSRVHVKLSGKLWQQKLKEMRQELLRFQSTLAEKQELQRINSEQKKKILMYEKQIKDRQSTKELHQRRIGQLQLKVQQAGLLENDFKRQAQKLRSLQEANKLIEDQLTTQVRLKKQLQEELKKNKEKFQIFQTGEMMKQRKQKNSNNLSSQDISNLSVFKSVVNQAETLRNYISKRKVHQIAFSPILSQKPVISQKDSLKRRQILNQLSVLKIGSDFSILERQVKKAEFQLPQQSIKQYSIGSLLLRGQENQLRIDLNYKSILSH